MSGDVATDVTWNRRPANRPRVVVLGSQRKIGAPAVSESLISAIRQFVDIVFIDLEGAVEASRTSSPQIPDEVDFVIVLGGDGSILRAARQMGRRQVPVLGVNLGRLGFLADLSPDQIGEVLPKVCNGECCIIDHLMFTCQVSNGGRVLAEGLGLNETAILGGPPYSILGIELYIDGELATVYSSDGLIVSTPVGSTAHNLSAGGPIVRKDLQAFVISAISPHTLTVRPVVDAADRTYEICVPDPNKATSVVVDGDVLKQLDQGDRVTIRRAEPSFQLIQVAGQGYYRTLNEKLGWGGRIHK